MKETWGEKFAKAADAGESVNFAEAIELAREVATEEDGDFKFAAEMVLQHYRYRHSVGLSTETLAMAARD